MYTLEGVSMFQTLLLLMKSVDETYTPIFLSDITKTSQIKYTENFTTKKDKRFWIFSYFCSKHRIWVLVRTHNLSFWAEIRQIMDTPVNPSFTI